MGTPLGLAVEKFEAERGRNCALGGEKLEHAA